MINIKRQVKQLRKESKEEVKIARQFQKQGDFFKASAHVNEAIALERSALRLERHERLKNVPLTQLPGVQRMEKKK